MQQREARAAEIQAAHPDLTRQECRDGANWERMKANHSRLVHGMTEHQHPRRLAVAARRGAHRQCGRGRAARPATNARRRGSSRTSASSSTSSADPGGEGSDSDEGDGEPAAARHLRLVPDPPARRRPHTFACLSAEERGAEVEQVAT